MAAIRGFVRVWPRMMVGGASYGLLFGSSSIRGMVERRSAPAEKARLPAPVTMPTHASSSSSRRPVASEKADHVSRSMELKASGRSRVMVAMWFSTS